MTFFIGNDIWEIVEMGYAEPEDSFLATLSFGVRVVHSYDSIICTKSGPIFWLS
jgi:hypothetical protein